MVNSCLNCSDIFFSDVDLTTDEYEFAVRIIVEANICPNDHGILLRIGQVETLFQEKYRNRELRWGVWPLSENQLEQTKSREMLSTLREQIQLKLGIDWMEVSILDLQKPLFSVIAASLTLSTIGPIPSRIVDQAHIWKQHFNPDGDIDDFTRLLRRPTRSIVKRQGMQESTVVSL